MNLQTAKIILELPEDYNIDILKKNYHRLAKLHHPDKCNDPNATNKFTQLNDAYSFMVKNVNVNVPDFNDILKTFNSFFKNVPVRSLKKMIIMLTPKEYITGCTKEIPIYSKCNCMPELCVFCAGSGYEIPNTFKSLKLEVCLECMGGGIIQNCDNCKFGDKKIGTNILTIHKKINLDKIIKFENFEISLKLSDPMYFYKNEQLYCYFDISLKESLTGFTKSFNDAFGYKHNIKTDCIIKCGDGYSLKHLILIFRVIYPECISNENIDKLKLIDF